MLYGRGAGALPTGSAVVSDIIFAAKHNENYYAPFKNNLKGNKETNFVTDFVSKYYIRMFVKDNAGVLATISGQFAKGNISIKEVKQMTSGEGLAEIIVITHPAYESNMKKTIEKLGALKDVVGIKGFIRIEE